MSIQVSVRLFARFRDVIGRDLVAVDVAHPNVADLRRCMAASHPALASLLDRSAIAVDGEFAGDDTVLSPASEVAIIPPVSGG